MVIDPKRNLRVAYVTTYDANDRAHWSGLGHAIMGALRMSGLEVTPLGPLRTNFKAIGRLKKGLYGRVLGRSYEFEREPIVARGYAKQVLTKLNQCKCDVVFSPGAIPISQLNCDKPIAIWADATWASYISHYKLDEQLCRETVRAGHRTERSAFARCSLMIFASQWAADSAIADYGANPLKVKVVPFGANFGELPDREAALQSAISRAADSCSLITIGVDWDRKGVPRSIELASLLNSRGLRTELTVVGCRIPAGVSVPDFVKVVSFVDKRTNDGERKISDLLGRAHFHVLLSHAEAFGVVFAEANAHAVPNIASDVGGISSAIVNDCGGRRFNVMASISELADYVEAHMRDRDRYLELANKARQQYDHRLNWLVAGAAVRRHIERVVMTQATPL
jgi:glycosyltransferase involved in cell wall biosynthesis